MNVFSDPLLVAYRVTTMVLGPLAPALLAWRRRRGKEDPGRIGERLGRTELIRPDGRLAWLHGASVGEGLALLPLVERLIERGFRVIVTTGTVTSAKILGVRLPLGAIHQYAPIDVPAVMGRFLEHWRPDLVAIAESEIWPNMLCETRRRSIPLVLVNARLSRRSFSRWRMFPRTIGPLLGRVDLILAQTYEDALRLERLGAPRVQIAGNLKYDVPPPPIDPVKLAELTAAIGPRPVWLAASTHPPEEDIIIEAHIQAAGQRPGLLTIIAPRHVARGADIAGIAAARGIVTALRSRGDPITRETGLYVADTMGELGVFYRLAGLVFVGKSIGGAAGGQNPIEPAKLGAAVLHGPDVANFVEVYRAIDTAKGAIMVADASTLARTLGALLSDPASARLMARAAGEAVDRLGGATNVVMTALEPYLMQMQLERR